MTDHPRFVPRAGAARPRPLRSRKSWFGWSAREWRWSRAGHAQKKWGPALLPAPTAPSEGSAGVRNLVKTRRPQPALDPGSPAQASLPIWLLSLARSLTDLPINNPEDHRSFNLPGLAETKTVW